MGIIGLQWLVHDSDDDRRLDRCDDVIAKITYSQLTQTSQEVSFIMNRIFKVFKLFHIRYNDKAQRRDVCVA